MRRNATPARAADVATAPPPEQASVPQRAAPDDRRATWLMRLGIGSLALLVSLSFVAVAILVGSDTGAAQLPQGPASPSTSALTSAPAVTPWALPERSWDPLPPPDPTSPLHPLQTTALDDVTPPTLTGCPRPQTVSDEGTWERLVRAQWSCIHRAWSPVFQRLGWSTLEPAVVFYPVEGSPSDCGYLSAPAFYCSSGDGTVFFGALHLEMARTWDLAVSEMVGHEYAHHLQKLAGLTAAKLSLPPRDEVERRSELQATCLSAMHTLHDDAVGFDAADLDSWKRRLDSMLIDSVHGGRESLTYWGTRGLYATTVGDCNTWTVDAADVD